MEEGGPKLLTRKSPAYNLEGSVDGMLNVSTEHSQTTAQPQALSYLGVMEGTGAVLVTQNYKWYHEHQGAKSRACGLDDHIYPAGHT